ncbi:MAG: carbon-nitrogen hydrolase family protein [Solirubrobacteraceae bacterium]
MRALLAQLAPADGDLQRNLERLESVLAGHRVELAVFPELFLQGCDLQRARELALHPQGGALVRVRAAAAGARSAVIVGFAERLADGRVANSAALIDAAGALLAVHRKAHLFGDGEHATFTEGQELLVVSLAGRRVGPLVCFDVEFPEPARELVRAGADLLVTIAANMAPYGDEHELAARARSLENRCSQLYVNRVGSHGQTRFLGGSMAIDASGRGTPARGGGEQLLEVEVPVAWADVGSDIDYLEHARRQLPVRAVGAGRAGSGLPPGTAGAVTARRGLVSERT